ncbi:MAG: 16S rRNA (cytidine(1402)-2'-O)-methyltransferase [Candidatus Coatesbacteria bacterium]|nr:16S rRNA (cytidine(1402)-2'-O)-methyltransferase [Candidatus Coatesbacteria bacterium]
MQALFAQSLIGRGFCEQLLSSKYFPSSVNAFDQPLGIKRTSVSNTADKGTLYVVATPIGNLADISERALQVLSEVGALACENTNHTTRIFHRHGLKKPKTTFSCNEHNEARVVPRILGLLNAGISVALCSNAGAPGVSDPGYKVISAVHESGGKVTMIPGPSAAIAALVSSGLPLTSFTFKGFPPRKQGRRRKYLELDAELPHTLVFFESPLRVSRFLAEALEVYGDRDAAVCIELTKLFEEVHRGTLNGLASEFENKAIKGEVTVVIAGDKRKGNREQIDRDDGPEDS